MKLIFNKLKKILAEVIYADPEDITPETELSPEWGIDAISTAKLIIECEKHFKITIHDEDVHTFKTLKNLADYIEEKKSVD